MGTVTNVNVGGILYTTTKETLIKVKIIEEKKKRKKNQLWNKQVNWYGLIFLKKYSFFITTIIESIYF